MKKASITSGQRESVESLAKAAAMRGVELGFKKADPDLEGIQMLLERGDDFQVPVIDAVIAAMKQFTVVNQYAHLKTPSSMDYPDEHIRGSLTVEQQIDTLRAQWPSLNPDHAIAYVRKVYSTLNLPEWVEGPYVIIRPGFFSSTYGEEVEEMLKAIGSKRKLHNYREGCLGPQYLQREERSLRYEAQMSKFQSGDLWVVGAQFGKLHRGEAVLRAREVISCRRHEWAFGARDVACMIFTHPQRFVRWEQLHADCAGDKYSPVAGGRFSGAPFFRFRGDELRFGTEVVDDAHGLYGSVSGLLPQES